MNLYDHDINLCDCDINLYDYDMNLYDYYVNLDWICIWHIFSFWRFGHLLMWFFVYVVLPVHASVKVKVCKKKIDSDITLSMGLEKSILKPQKCIFCAAILYKLQPEIAQWEKRATHIWSWSPGLGLGRPLSAGPKWRSVARQWLTLSLIGPQNIQILSFKCHSNLTNRRRGDPEMAGWKTYTGAGLPGARDQHLSTTTRKWASETEPWSWPLGRSPFLFSRRVTVVVSSVKQPVCLISVLSSISTAGWCEKDCCSPRRSSIALSREPCGLIQDMWRRRTQKDSCKNSLTPAI